MGVYSKKRRDGTTAWFYDFSYNQTRYRAVGGTTKTQALRSQEKRRSEVISGDFKLESCPSNIKIDDFAQTYLERRKHLRSQKRDDLSTRTLLTFFSGKILNIIQPQNIEDYIRYRMTSGVANGTINRELACLKKMFNLAIKWGDVKKRNPVSDVDFLEEPPGRTRFLSIDECKKLIKCSENHLKPIIITALNTGMRLGEILSLKWEKVHIDSVIDPFIELVETKNNKKRFIPLNDDMIPLFKSIRSDLSYVFIGTQNKPLNTVRIPFGKALKKAEIIDFRFHDLRHTFASHYVMNGGDLLSLKEILGHSSFTMVQKYAHLASAHKRKQINKLANQFVA